MATVGLTIEQVELPPDHALMVASGVLDRTTVIELEAGVGRVLDSGARYLVLDLAQVTRCDAAALLAIATGARRLSQRRGWLRLIATSLPVVAALETLMLVLDPTGRSMRGRWLGPDRDFKVDAGTWSLTRGSGAARTPQTA